MWDIILAELKYHKYLIGLLTLLAFMFKIGMGENNEEIAMEILKEGSDVISSL